MSVILPLVAVSGAASVASSGSAGPGIWMALMFVIMPIWAFLLHCGPKQKEGESWLNYLDREERWVIAITIAYAIFGFISMIAILILV